MPSNKQKLELTWIGKENRPKLEPRILVENAEKSYHAKHRVGENDLFDNKLIFGDNLLALKALEQEYAGKVKCVFIDPPYNTGQAFEHYDDGLEHSTWLSLLRERIEILKKLLCKDGVIFCQLNDEEMAYGKVLMDEVLGRINFLNQVSVKMKQTAGASGGGEDKKLKKNIEYILIYARERNADGGFQKFNEVYDEESLFDLIDEMEANGKSWKYTSVLLSKGAFLEEKTVFDGSGEPIKVSKYKGVQRTTIAQLIKSGCTREQAYTENFEGIFSDTNAQTSIRTRIIDEFKELDGDELLEATYIPRSGREKGRIATHYYISPTIRRVIWLSDSAHKKGTRIVKLEKAGTFWDGFPLNNLTKEGGVQFPQGKKPEALIKKVLDLATNPGDLVLDSFLGSGTTAAVAHKMGRRWIGIELGEHCHTHCIPRLKKVIDGEDPGGITKAVDWKGGGGFRYYRLAPSLLEKDKWDNWVISKDYNAAMLTEAVCKLEGFTYAPSDSLYWQHGHSTERDFIYVTTAGLKHTQLQQLSDEVGPECSLLVVCTSFRGGREGYPNLTVKKIPKAVLARCEWGKDDYSLRVENLPPAPPPEGQKELF
ncbi:MAG: site-specific DNA-methyltransferase [Chthoniobacterales bacterium]